MSVTLHEFPISELCRTVLQTPSGIFEVDINRAWLTRLAYILPGIPVYAALIDEANKTHEKRSAEAVGHVVTTDLVEYDGCMGVFAEIAFTQDVAMPDGSDWESERCNHFSLGMTGPEGEITELVVAYAGHLPEDEYQHALHFRTVDPYANDEGE